MGSGGAVPHFIWPCFNGLREILCGISASPRTEVGNSRPALRLIWKLDSKPSHLHVGIIGCGWAARNLHAPAIRQVGTIAAATDPFPNAAATLGAEKLYPTWQQLLADPSINVVLIASPPADHAPAAIAALQSGRAVLLEKPVAANLPDAEQIAAAAANRVLAVGFNQRCHPAFLRLRRQIATGHLGSLQSISFRWSSSAGLGARTWLGQRSLGGGAILDLGSHFVDLLRFLTASDLLSLSAHSHSTLLDDQQATLHAQLPSGASATAHLSLIGPDLFEVEVTGSRGRVRISPYGAAFRDSYLEQWRALARAVQGSGPVAANIDDGLASLRWLTRAAETLPVRPRESAPPVEFPLSAISSTTIGYSAVRTTVAHLRRQTAASQIELVLVGPTLDSLQAPAADLEGFASVRRVPVGPVQSIAHANAAGVRHARGRLVALTEDHCFPEPQWAASLIHAHSQGDFSVIGPVVLNANPGSMVSEADFVIGYGPWMDPLEPVEMPFLPGHNSCYRRDELLALGGRLERLLEAETVLHMEWSSQGRRLRAEPAARTRHVNYSLWRSWIPVQFLAGRLFGGLRAATWPRRKQLFFAAASPLIPAVRLWRTLAEFRRPGRSLSRFLRMAPALVLGLTIDGIGQGVGYALGPGRSMESLSQFEFNRINHVRREDRHLWTSP